MATGASISTILPKFKGPGADLWRVDDGGEIHAEGFDVLFLLTRGTTYWMALNWAGAEGSALSLHAAEGADSSRS